MSFVLFECVKITVIAYKTNFMSIIGWFYVNNI
jgi:hypothetical protein